MARPASNIRSSSSESRATLHDVAARARVSIATVSRALNGLAVSPRNRERVLEAAHDLGYVANEAARALRSERSQTMGLIFFDLRSTLGIELLDSLSESIEDAGYALLISTARGDAGRFEVLMHRFLERRVDALFCINARGEGQTLARYHAANIPVIAVITGAGTFAELPLIEPSIAEASKLLARHLQELGHERIALVGRRAYRAPLRTIGRTLEAHGMKVEDIAASEAGGMSEIVTGLMARTARPTAVIAPGGYAHGLLAACKAAGIGVPEDLSIVSLGNVDAERRRESRAVSCLTIDSQRVGRAAGGAMLGWLAGVRPVDNLRVENGSFVARATTGKAAKVR